MPWECLKKTLVDLVRDVVHTYIQFQYCAQQIEYLWYSEVDLKLGYLSSVLLVRCCCWIYMGIGRWPVTKRVKSNLNSRAKMMLINEFKRWYLEALSDGGESSKTIRYGRFVGGSGLSPHSIECAAEWKPDLRMI